MDYSSMPKLSIKYKTPNNAGFGTQMFCQEQLFTWEKNVDLQTYHCGN